MSTNVSVKKVMDDKILTGPNFLDWLKNLIIVLKEEKLAYAILSQSLNSQLLMHLKVFRMHIKDDRLIVRGQD